MCDTKRSIFGEIISVSRSKTRPYINVRGQLTVNTQQQLDTEYRDIEFTRFRPVTVDGPTVTFGSADDALAIGEPIPADISAGMKVLLKVERDGKVTGWDLAPVDAVDDYLAFMDELATANA